MPVFVLWIFQIYRYWNLIWTLLWTKVIYLAKNNLLSNASDLVVRSLYYLIMGLDSKPLSGSMVDVAFCPSKVDQMSTDSS